MFVCILSERAVREMTYIVSGGTLNPTHSLTLTYPVAEQSFINSAKGLGSTVSFLSGVWSADVLVYLF